MQPETIEGGGTTTTTTANTPQMKRNKQSTRRCVVHTENVIYLSLENVTCAHNY